MTGVHQRTVEVFDLPLTRKQTDTSLPRPIQCALCNNVAYCKVNSDLGDVIKVEFRCKTCCESN